MRRPLLALALAACVPPEEGIDNTLVYGTVRIDAVSVSEATDLDSSLREPQALDDLYLSTRIIGGQLDLDDADFYAIRSTIDIPWQQLEISLTDPSAVALVELYSLDQLEGGRPKRLEAVNIHGTGLLSFPLVVPPATTGYTSSTSYTSYTSYTGSTTFDSTPRMVGGESYAIAIALDPQSAATGYTIVAPGGSPADQTLLVGAYGVGDPAMRGAPLGGSTIEGWTGGSDAEDYTWTGSYEIYLLRSLRGEGADIEAVEGAESVYLFAGDWPTLNSPLASGTFYSAEPVALRLPETEPESNFFADALRVDAGKELAIDTIAEAVVVQEFSETEPNNLQPTWPPAVDLATSADVNDAGLLSGPGFADRFLGSITYGPELYGYTHDSDAWRFTVPEPCRIVVTATWDDASACLDVYLVDDVTGIGLDYAASFEMPEVGGGAYVFQPDTTYYLVMLGYMGEPEGASTAYDLLVEQLPP